MAKTKDIVKETYIHPKSILGEYVVSLNLYVTHDSPWMLYLFKLKFQRKGPKLIV